jgi:excisionase family DNA binding protein
MSSIAEDKLWTVDEVASYLELPMSSIYKMTCKTASVRMPHTRIGGRLRFRKSDIDSWLESLTFNNADVLMKARLRASSLVER